jgi:hypothetical protein
MANSVKSHQKTKKNAFVIGPIGERKSDTREWADKIFVSLITPVLKKAGYKATRSDQMPKSGLITNQIMSHIFNDQLVIADLTKGNPNAFYELAVRHVIQKPVILLIDSNEKIPFDLINVRAIKLHSDWSGLDEAKEELKKQIKSLEKDQTCESIVTPFINTFKKTEVLDETLIATLDDAELRLLIDKAVCCLRGKALEKEIYAVFDEYLLEEFIGVTTRERIYDIELSPDNEFGKPLIRANVRSSYTAVNESLADRQLFHDDVIASGKYWPPTSAHLDKNMANIEKGIRFDPDQFEIGAKKVHPQISTEWSNGTNAEEQFVLYSVKYAHTIESGQELDVRYSYSLLQDQNDYIMRTHRNICDRITVNITKPKNIDIVLIWFKTANEPHAKILPPNKGSLHYSQTLKGITIPGNGVAICWRYKGDSPP